MAGDFTLGGINASQLFNQIKATGITDAHAAILIGNWILETANKSKRTFGYKTSFPSLATDCAFQFTRTFHHDDWVDGESVVQAEQTPTEEGFNTRFHSIEADIDNLGAEVAKAMLCLAEMRLGLRTLLDEIRTEINLINSDIFDCCKTDPPTPTPGVIGGFTSTPSFMGATKFFDKNVNVWQTNQGLMMLPSVVQGGVNLGPAPRVLFPGEIARFFAEEPAVAAEFGGRAVPKDDLVQRFGDSIIMEGVTLREAVAILPDGARFDSLDALIEAVAEREAGALRVSGADVSTVTSMLGLGHDVTAVAAAPVTNLEVVPADARTALANAGITTVESLAHAAPAEIARILDTAGVRATTADAASWTASARTLVHLR